MEQATGSRGGLEAEVGEWGHMCKNDSTRCGGIGTINTFQEQSQVVMRFWLESMYMGVG